MATVAAITQGAAMAIIRGVAALAGIRCAAVVAPGLVAIATAGLRVFPEERKAGLLVIKSRRLPVALDMALRAVFSHRAAMWIVLLVTACAVVCQSFADCTVDMTQPALDPGMRAKQREPGECMVEVGGGFPAPRAVAIATAIAKF